MQGRQGRQGRPLHFTPLVFMMDMTLYDICTPAWVRSTPPEVSQPNHWKICAHLRNLSKTPTLRGG